MAELESKIFDLAKYCRNQAMMHEADAKSHKECLSKAINDERYSEMSLKYVEQCYEIASSQEHIYNEITAKLCGILLGLEED